MNQTRYYYTYYSYEEWGRGYIGSRGCKCLPEEDIKYFGTFKDKNFKPTRKIILKDDYATREEAYADEIILQQYYKVVENPHFANKSYQTSTKFYFTDGSIGGKKSKELGLGIHALNSTQKSEAGKKGGEKCKTFGIGFYKMTREQRIAQAKKNNSQKWMCTETGYITTCGPLAIYQKKRGIDTSKRRKV